MKIPACFFSFSSRLALLAVGVLFFQGLQTSSLAQSAAAVEAPESAIAAGQTSLWLLEDEDNRVYLLGSVHLLRPSDHPLPQPMLDAYADAEKLVVEISQKDMMSSDSMAFIMKEGTYTDGETLEQHLEPANYQLLQDSLSGLGFPPTVFDQFKPWFAAISYVSLVLMKEGYNPQSGVESFFEGKAAADEKPVESLETVEFQIGLFTSMSEGMDDQFLVKTIEETDTMVTMFDDVITAWKTGQPEEIAKLLNESFEDFPELRQAFLVDRNSNWVPKIEELVEGDENVLVIVGAGHLVGDDSVVDMLEKRGHEVTQL